MRIACLFSTSGHSGVDRVAGHLIPALARRGYQVDQLKVRRHGPELASVPQRVRVIDLGASSTYASLPAIVHYLHRERPLVLLSDKDKVNRTALLARALSGTATRNILRLGTTVSVDLASRGAFERWLQRTSMGRLYRFADCVIVNARSVAEDLTRYTGLPAAWIRVVPNPAVPESLFIEPQPRPDHPWLTPDQPPVVLGVGELGSRKDFPTLLRAFAILRRKRPCRLIILGRGRAGQRGSLLTLATELGIGDDLDLAGFRPDPIAFMAHSAVFCLTSLWEGNPLVLAEALAVGTPVVAVDGAGGTREVLDYGRYGPLIPPGDHEALARALAETMDHPHPSAYLREAARPYAIEASTDAYLDAMRLPRRVGELDTATGGSR